MVQSANATGIPQREISFKNFLQIWLTWSRQVHAPNDEVLRILFVLMSQQRVRMRQGINEPRVVKRRPKAFLLLTLLGPLT
jgi:hypothetical protein